MRSREVLSAFIFIGLATLGPRTVEAQGSILVNIEDLEPHELRAEAFALSSQTELSIEAVGADDRVSRFGRNNWSSDTDYWRGNAWILDATSREVVWELEEERTSRGRGGYEEFDGTVQLPAGQYIAYFASYSGFQISDNIWRRNRNDRIRYDDDGLSEDFKLSIRGNGQAIPIEDVRSTPTQTLEFVSFRDMEDDEDERIGFRVDRPTEVSIYAQGEATDGSTYDYGWVMNTDTREMVWRLDYWDSYHAGGAEKNRMSRETITLQPGNYAAVYVSDDSHDAYDWNSAPPHDPEYWGLTVAVTNQSDLGQIETFAYENIPAGNVIVEMTRIEDNETVSEGFTLSDGMDVRVYAIGEMTRSGSYDFGWIIDATTRQIVWEMDYRDTEHAGGGEKNRLADEIVHLDAGSYIVNYTSDGSYSYRDWSGPPMDPDSWGITVLGLQGYNANAISEYDDNNNPSVLARLTGIRDHDYSRRDFTINGDTDVRVYAIGEGEGRTMYDYAWIESDRGRTVWEMTYRSTDWAGGARKNRMVNEVINLPEGDYTVYYESDGSHSFNDWNDDAPSDPTSYGVTVFVTD